MNAYRLFVTEMSPNGTNALIVADNNGQVKAWLEEATFGVRIPNDPLANALVLNGEDLVAIPECTDAISPDDCLCTEISPERARRRRACSPIDPNGDKTMNFLNLWFPDGNGGAQ